MDNGDGSSTDDLGDIYDNATGDYLGYENGDGTWTDWAGQVWTSDNKPINDGYIDNGDGTYTSIYTGETVQGGGDIGDGTPAQETGIGGSHVTLDPDEFGDVYTVNGQWVGNIFGLSEPGTISNTPGIRGTGNTPGGAYKTGGGSSNPVGGNQSAADLVKTLQSLLAQAHSSNAPTTQQQAISAALANAQKQASSDTLTKFAIAGGALLALYAISQRRRVA